jgi:hypothetical protein
MPFYPSRESDLFAAVGVTIVFEVPDNFQGVNRHCETSAGVW